MKKTKLIIRVHALPPGVADLITPVTIYLKIRDRFPNAILLESSDYHGNRNSMSYVCFDLISNLTAENNTITISFPDGEKMFYPIIDRNSLPDVFNDYLRSFDIEEDKDYKDKIANGLFGYTSYDAVRYFKEIGLSISLNECSIPELYYSLYRFIIAINHFTNRVILIENIPEGGSARMEEVLSLLKNRILGSFQFSTLDKEISDITDGEFIEMVRSGKKHCFHGDVSQMVLSRRFSQRYIGDEFNVYRALRNINPSPYLFYFDYGSFKLFGSSPETQIVIEKGIARINPIAGTFKRSGNDEEDRQLAIELSNDKKENSEHIMLVDLAKEDLRRNSGKVNVKTFREIQFYSHVIHLVSEVTGELRPGFNPLKVFGDTFPAGTLTGAPRLKAMELIAKYEKRNRGYYGGAIGHVGFNGDINQALMIRTFLSRNNTLFYQAGAGIINASVEEKELNEVNNKLGALKQAVMMAARI